MSSFEGSCVSRKTVTPEKERRKTPNRERQRSLSLEPLRERLGPTLKIRPCLESLCPKTIFEGNVHLANIRRGASLKCLDVIHQQNVTIALPEIPPGLKILLKLEGNACVKIGGRLTELSAGQGADAVARGMIVTLDQPADLAHYCQPGMRERIVIISLSREWFEEANLDFFQYLPHLSQRPWTPSPRCAFLAEQLIRSQDSADNATILARERYVLELVYEALSGNPSESKTTDFHFLPREARRIQQVRTILDSPTNDKVRLQEIAARVGSNINTLQKQFKSAYGITMGEYLRDVRLRRAASAIEHNGISVAEAAAIAGYTSHANFSTAFKRVFGFSPKALSKKR